MYKEQIKKLIEEYKTVNPFELCEKLDINVMYVPLGALKGFYRVSGEVHFITINKDLELKEQYFTCAHELGHYFLHQESNTIFLSTTLMLPSKLEIQANKFAHILLSEYYKE